MGRIGAQREAHRHVAAAGVAMHDGVREQLLDHQRQAQAVVGGDAAIRAERLDECDRVGEASMRATTVQSSAAAIVVALAQVKLAALHARDNLAFEGSS